MTYYPAKLSRLNEKYRQGIFMTYYPVKYTEHSSHLNIYLKTCFKKDINSKQKNITGAVKG